jgi:multidrug efflux pump subunit AcrA (membrane-fusion protein)
MNRTLPLSLLLLAGCSRPSAHAPAVAAPEKPKPESELAQTTLPVSAARALGIATTPARVGPVQDALRLPGLVASPVGYEAVITAPLAGVVRLPDGATAPAPGTAVAKGQILFEIEPVMGPTEAVQLAALKRGFENEKNKAVEGERIAKTEFERLQGLLKEGLRSQQDVDQAHVRWVGALEDVKAANAKLEAFSDAPRPVRCVRGGTLLTLAVSPGQTVAAAAPLATVADLSRLWVKVAVPESDLARIDARRPAVIALRPAGHGGVPLARHLYLVVPRSLVPQVDPVRHTADLFYDLLPVSLEEFARFATEALANPAAARPPTATAFARDQLLTVPVPLDEPRQECVVPVAAVLYDTYGGAWVYVEQKADAKTIVYERRRVELGPVTDGGVIVRPPLKAGEKVVSVGAGALFSREFYKPPVTHD